MNKIRELRKQKGWTQEELGQKLGLSSNAISGYEKGNRQPNLDILSQMAELFGVSIDTILGREDSISPSFGRPIQIQPELVVEDEVLIPVVASLRCGFNQAGEPYVIKDRKPVPISYTRRWGKSIVFVEAVGESMLPTIRPGDLCVSIPGDAWADDNIVVVDINDSDTIKRIRRAKDGGVDLIPDNPEFDVMHLSPDDIIRYRVRILGRIAKIIGPDL